MVKKIVLGAVLLGLVAVSSQTFATGELSVNRFIKDSRVGKVVKMQTEQVGAMVERAVERDEVRNQERRERSHETSNLTAIWVLIGGLFGFVMRAVKVRV